MRGETSFRSTIFRGKVSLGVTPGYSFEETHRRKGLHQSETHNFVCDVAACRKDVAGAPNFHSQVLPLSARSFLALVMKNAFHVDGS